MYRQPLRLLTVLCLLGIAPAFAAQVSAESGPLPSSVTSVAAATGSVRQPSSSVRSSARPAQRQWQGNPARKGYDDFRNKHHLRPEGQHRLPRPRIQRDGSWRPGRRD
ncbi:hypothetical protein ACQRCW_07100 [Desulfovibrio sp. SGI.082]|jgi:hypothetical protein|uniref:hypothetical protein n=1 Tax=Desulfovibrio TaxID=872 RepID=UPI00261917AB|nr:MULTISPECIES: hypothetical protein [Desulfovibrio]MCI7373897.1 hypothetical protein [Desulfovibrio piger]MCI7404829.1 hypothetical protein [Desulfovibrio piger]MDD6248870.1 hypothetical protein [Desulfovibrio piger]MDY4941229.1 hypothetical protein [Desulfovibrio sp.]MDY5394002.1 hypothetical protein [Desulfovibrio sp.]